MADLAQIWHPLPRERGKAFDAFKIFRELPRRERTYLRAWQKWLEVTGDTKKNPNEVNGTFQQWYRKFDWENRAEAFDRWRAEQDAIADQEERRNARKRRRAFINKYEQKLAEFMRKLDPEDLAQMRTMAFVTSTYVDLSRKEYGDDAENQIVGDTFDPSEHIDSAKQQLAHLIAQSIAAGETQPVLGLPDGQAETSDSVRLVVLGETVPTAKGH